jgi:hypothetical protein
MKNKLFLLAGLLCIVIYSCNLQPQNNSSSQKNTDSASTGTKKHFTVDQLDTSYHSDRWSYQVSDDPMKNKFYAAIIFSPETLDFKPIYDKGAMVLLEVIYSRKQNFVVLRVTQGAFLNSYPATDSLRARFDDNAPEEFAYYPTEAGIVQNIYLKPASKFINELKKSKMVVIETTFYKNGTRQMEFNTANLVWNH